MRYCWKIILVLLVVITIVTIRKFYCTKQHFIEGMWSSNKDDIFMYIDNKVKKDGWRGAYLVSSKSKINEPFKIKAETGIGDGVKLTTKDSSNLKKKILSKMSISDGTLEIVTKDGTKHKLFKDTETSEDMLKNKK